MVWINYLKRQEEFDANKCVSLVLVNDERGVETFKAEAGDLDIRETRIEDIMQPALRIPNKPPTERGQFWKNYNEEFFEQKARRYNGHQEYPLSREETG